MARATKKTVLKALELADRIMCRNGLQAIRGEAWNDDEHAEIRAAIRALGGDPYNGDLPYLRPWECQA